MALGDEGASFSNYSFNAAPRWKYHVFLSFRGEDTRTNFTDFLYNTLVGKGILTFRDEEQLERGEVISEQLLKVIEESLSAIVVLSPEYATSTWCLDELQTIVESRKMLEGLVFPVFYNVEPSDVRYQKGNSFAEALRKHEERYKEDTEKVERWRQALRKVADLSGYPSKNRHQSQLIEEIATELWTKIQAKLPSFNDGLVGIDSRMEDMFSLLGRRSKDVCFIGIWGMGGIGKTTLARVVYETIRNEFEISCFLENVREISGERRDGLLELQRKLLSHLKISGIKINDSFEGKKQIRNLLFNKKVLLVLDDISANSQLENLAGNQEWFGQGSRIIITTRDKQLLTSHGVSEIYPIQVLNSEESLQLFCQKAFKDQPQQFDLELSKKVVHYSEGLPLALKVLGSFLCGRSVPVWKNALDEIKKFAPEDIIRRLRISYDSLNDNKNNIFLNIACFFKGMKKGQVTHIIEICDLYPTIGINVLLEKSLLTEYDVFGEWYVGMHDILQEMGKSIIIQQSHNDAGKLSRLWLQEDIDNILTKNKGTNVIQGIAQNLCSSSKARYHPDVFSNMCNLKLLKLNYFDLPLGLNCLPEGLKYLEWKEFPLKELPLNVQLDELVELTMHNSKIKQLWHGTKSFKKLKFIDLKDSKDLIRFPSVSGVPCVEWLVLEGCKNLIEVHESVGQLKKLKELNMRGCVNLEILPSKLEMDSLKVFILSGCSKLKKLPKFGDYMAKSLRILNTFGCSKFSRLPGNLDKFEALEELNGSGTAIKEVPTSIVYLKYLERVSLGGGKETKSNWWSLSLPLRWKFWGRPFSTGMMLPPLSCFPLLKQLNLSYCNISDESLLHDLGGLSSLLSLDLSGNNFIELPASCIANLANLYELQLNWCPRLKSVPKLPPNVDRFFATDCTSLETLSDPQYLHDFFATHSHEKEKRFWFHGPFLFFRGSEIPPWFNNQDYFHDVPLYWVQLHDRDFSSSFGHFGRTSSFSRSPISIIVEIPDYCLSSEWWGIVVCLVLENQSLPSRWFLATLRWICRTPGTKLPYPSSDVYPTDIKDFRHPHLCILLLRGNDSIIQRYLKGDHNKLELSFEAQNCNSPCDHNLKISKCGCRVICKEDLEVWDKARCEREQNSFEMPSNSLYKTRARKIADEWAKISNEEENLEKQYPNLLSETIPEFLWALPGSIRIDLNPSDIDGSDDDEILSPIHLSDNDEILSHIHLSDDDDDGSYEYDGSDDDDNRHEPNWVVVGVVIALLIYLSYINYMGFPSLVIARSIDILIATYLDDSDDGDNRHKKEEHHERRYWARLGIAIAPLINLLYTDYRLEIEGREGLKGGAGWHKPHFLDNLLMGLFFICSLIYLAKFCQKSRKKDYYALILGLFLMWVCNVRLLQDSL